MKKLVAGWGAMVLALAAAGLGAGEAPGPAAGQATATGQAEAAPAPKSWKGTIDDLADADFPPELLDCLREEAAKLGFGYLKTPDDFIGFCGSAADYMTIEQLANAQALRRRIIFVAALRMRPTKDNCLQAINAPEKGDERYHAAMRRDHAFALLAEDGKLTPADLPAIKDSFHSARLCRSKVGAILAIFQLDREEGGKMAEEFLESEGCPFPAKTKLLRGLSGLDGGFDFLRYRLDIAKAMQHDEKNSSSDIQVLLDNLAMKIAHEANAERRENMLHDVEAMFARAEKDANGASKKIAQYRAMFMEALKCARLR